MEKKSLLQYSDEELFYLVDMCEADTKEEWFTFLREQQRREVFAESLKGGKTEQWKQRISRAFC